MISTVQFPRFFPDLFVFILKKKKENKAFVVYIYISNGPIGLSSSYSRAKPFYALSPGRKYILCTYRAKVTELAYWPIKKKWSQN